MAARQTYGQKACPPGTGPRPWLGPQRSKPWLISPCFRKARPTPQRAATLGAIKRALKRTWAFGAPLPIGLVCLALAGCNQGPFTSNPYMSAVEVNPELRGAEVQKSYNQGFKNDYIAISGSELLRDVILNSLDRFVMAVRARASEDDLRQNLTSFAYFAEPTSVGMKDLCNPSRRFIALAALRSWNSSFRQPCAGTRRILPVQLGYEGRVFVVPANNSFVKAIDLAALRRALNANRETVRWSDLDPAWPKRPIRWIIPSQFPLGLMFRDLGAPAPSRFLLADTYTNSYQHIEDHPDNLLITYASVGLEARLQGFQFRTLPVRDHSGADAVSPTLENLVSRYPRLMTRRVVLYINTAASNACILGAFASYSLRHNIWLMSENNLAPLSAADRREEIRLLPADLTREASGMPTPLCAAFNHHQASLYRGGDEP